MIVTGNILKKLNEFLDKAIAADGADMGNIQFYDKQTGTLSIVAHKGFTDSFIRHFASVKPFDSSACGRAFGSGGIITIGNVANDKAFLKHLGIARQAGFSAVKSVPLFFTNEHTARQQIGVLSTHFREEKTQWDLTLLEEIAREITLILSRITASTDVAAYSS